MIYYSIPADFKKETIDKICQLNDSFPDSKISETYGNLTLGNLIPSGRVRTQLPDVDLELLREYIEYSNSKGLYFNYTLNATHLNGKDFNSADIKKYLEFIDQLCLSGVASFTVALPTLFEIIREFKPDINIKISTLCQVTSINKVLFYKLHGASRIVLDESINKKIDVIKGITQYINDIELIVNPICLKDCVYRTFHYNQITNDSISTESQTSVMFYEHRCVQQRLADIGNYLKISWIRPEDIKKYVSIGVNHFKIQGRHAIEKGDVLKTAKIYMTERYDGNLMDLIYCFKTLNNFNVNICNRILDGFMEPFFQEKFKCIDNCFQCNYCQKFKDLISKNNEEFAAIQEAASKFYDEFDPFKSSLRENIKKVEATTESIDFDL